MRWAISAAIVVLVSVGTVRTQTRATRASTTDVKAIASVIDIMKTMTIPFSNAVFEAGAEPPKDDASWEAVRRQAVALAEAGNLLMLGSRVRESRGMDEEVPRAG